MKTPFFNKHIELNGKIVDFAGYKMPIQYTSVFKEVKGVRETIGIFDVSHMGEIEISGPDSEDFVNWITTNNVSKLSLWQVQYTTMLYDNGGIVDDLLVYSLPDKYLLVVNASNREKDFKWIIDNKRGEVEIKDKGDYYFQIAVQGPLSSKAIKKVTEEDPSDLGFYWAKKEKIEGREVLISRTGYTGEDGFEIYGNSEYGTEIWDNIMNAGRNIGMIPCGLGARNILRMEMGYCLYGNDITKDTSPLEAGLSWLVKLDKGDFIGKKALLKQKNEGVKRILSGLEPTGRIIPRHGFQIFKDARKIGEITSGSHSPSLNHPIALGYIKKPFNKKETEVEIKIRKKMVKARVISLPFWKHGSIKR